MLNAGFTTTRRASTPSRVSSERMNRPKGSSPTPVTQATECPMRAAATATFADEPPRNLPNRVTSSRWVFISRGYRSTPHLPMVQTSSTGSSTVMTP